MFAATKWLIVVFISSVQDFSFDACFRCSTISSRRRKISDCRVFFCNKQNNAHHEMYPWPTNPSNSLPHPHLPLLRYAMSLPYFTMAAASAAATPAIASSVALNIFVVVSFYAANIYLQNVNILAAAGIKVGIPPAFLPAGRRGVCRPRPLRSQRRRRRERNASFAPPPSQRRRWKEGSVSSAPFPTAVGGRRGACRPRPPRSQRR